MANEVASSSTSLTWSQALVLLESPSPNGVPPSASYFLRAHLDQLQRPHDPFPPSQHSKTQLQSGTLTLAKRQVAVSKPDQQLALDVATRFSCDELEAYHALTHARRAKGAHSDKLAEDEWDRVTAWLFEERMAVLAVIALLLRSHDDPDNACYELAVELVPEIVTPSFTSSLLAAFTRRTAQHLPDAVRPSRTHSAFWTKQLVREQRTLLELVFLAYYSPRPADGLELARVLEAIKATDFGQRQELFGHFDAEAQGVVREIGDLLVVIALEACNLEVAMELEYPIGAPGEATVDASSVYHPANLVKVTELVEGLVGLDAERASPILLAWAFLLSKVTASLLERGVPEAYHDWAEQSLRVEAPQASSSRSSSTQPLFQLYAAHALSPASAFFPALLSILRSPLLGHSAQRESFSAAANHEPNAIGYLSVLRGLVVSIPNLVRLPFLSSTQLSALYDAYAALYGNAASASMCSNFWTEQAVLNAALDGDDESSMLLERSAQSTGESDIVDLARSRFPLQFGGLTGLVRALCAGAAGLAPAEHPGSGSPAASSNDEVLAARCAQSAFAYLATLPSLTHVVPSASVPGVGAAAPLPYEVAAYPDPETGYAYRATRPIGVSRSVAIPVGAQGRLVSQQGTKPVVVAWDVEWSAWRLFADVLEDYAGVKGRAGGAGAGARRDVFGSKEAQTDGLPMEWDREDEHDKDVTAVLDILRITILNDHSLAVALIDHLATAPGRLAESADPASARNSFVEVLFRILERSLAPNLDRPPPTALVSSLLGLIAALLPSFPGVIWTYLRGSALLFPSTKASSNSASGYGYGAGAAGIASSSSSARPQVLHAERLSGQYPITLALLSLVHALVLEEQVAACVTRSDFRETKHGVLVRALAWVRDTVWPSFGAWRFASLVEKYELARRCTSVLNLVLEESAVAAAASTSSSPSSSPVVQVVTDAFIGPRTTVAQLSPVLSTLASGPDGIVLLRRAGRFADAQALEDLVRSSLSLVLGLLRLRRRTKGTTSSLLEKLCLSPSGSASYAVTAGSAHGFAAELDGVSGSEGRPARRPELLESLVRFVVAPLDGALAVQAARIVTLLCLSTVAGETAPASMTALLGGSEGLERLLTALLAVVEDHLAAQEVQVAIWDLLSAIVDSQPGLGMLLVTGRSSPFSIDDLVPAPPKDDKGKARELNDAEKAAQELAKSLAPSAPKPLSRTAIGVALSTVGTWSTIWAERPALLAAVLRFFDFAWQHLVEYGPALDDFRARTSTWEAFVKIACKNPGSEPHDDEGVADYCHRVTARAHAARILALDVQAALAKPKAEEAPSVKAFLTAFKDQTKVSAALTSAMASSCAPELHQGIYELVHSTFPGLDLDALRNAPSTHPLDEAREFGSEYLYALAVVRRRLDGFVADADSAVDGDALADVVAQTAQLNRNFSLLEAQILDTRSWRQLLEIVSPLARKDAATAAAATAAVGLVAREIAQEARGGQIMTTVQAERLSILLTLVQVLGAVEPAKAKVALVNLVVSMAAMFASETLEPLESVARREAPTVHVALFRTAFLAFRQLEACAPPPEMAPDEPPELAPRVTEQAVDPEQRTRLATATEAILRDVLTATRDLLVLARARKELDIEQDLALAVAVVSQVLKSTFAPPAAVWLAHIHALDLLRCAFDVFVHMDQLEPGRPLYAQHVLDLCLAFATSSPRAAEQLPLEGAMTALTNNALTAAAEAGAIALVSPTDASRTPQHELWTSMLALVVALVAALGESTRFVEQDVTGFVRLYGQQVVRALSWTSSTPVTAAGLEELSGVVALMHGVARSSSAVGVSPSSPVVAVAGVFVEQSLHLLQHLVYALLHPNHLAALVEGLTPAERGYLEKEATEQDVDKRPVVQAVTLKVVQLARDLVGALVEFADAWAMLLKDPMDWRSERAVVLPTATVTAGDKASLGTLFDLSTFCIDTLRSPPPSSPAPSLTSPASSPSSPSPFPTLPAASQPVLRAACAETLEACLLLSATQLALRAQQQGGATRALHELGGEVVELVDKAVSLSVKGDERNRKLMLEVVRRKLGTWV
ncbi:hypothetical protein JCM9279_001252 [Rhodotorula babjevae]